MLQEYLQCILRLLSMWRGNWKIFGLCGINVNLTIKSKIHLQCILWISTLIIKKKKKKIEKKTRVDLSNLGP